MCNLVHTQTVSVPSLGASFSQLAIPTLGSSKTLVNLSPGSVWVVNPYGSFVCSSVVMVQFDQIVKLPAVPLYSVTGKEWTLALNE